MPRMFCQRCGKDMGEHKYHARGTCDECKKKFGSLKREMSNDYRIEVDEKSRTWEAF